MVRKPLKSIWVFKEGLFVGRRWEVVDAQDEQSSTQNDSVSAPAMAAFEACEKTDVVNDGLSEELSKKLA